MSKTDSLLQEVGSVSMATLHVVAVETVVVVTLDVFSFPRRWQTFRETRIT